MPSGRTRLPLPFLAGSGSTDARTTTEGSSHAARYKNPARPRCRALRERDRGTSEVRSLTWVSQRS